MGDVEYLSVIKSLSDRIVKTQGPIRILDAIKWGDDVQKSFFQNKYRRQPEVDAGYYRRNPLSYDVNEVRRAFQTITQDIHTQLGNLDPAGNIMLRMCREYQRVLDMLEARGTPDFSLISQELYGRSSDTFHAGGPTVADLGKLLDRSLRQIDQRMFLEASPRSIPTQKAIPMLQAWLDRAFPDPEARVRVIESDGIVADAAAGSDYIKLRANSFFSERDLQGLEAHEGWVHVGTTLNGRLQPTCSFLCKGTPSDTITQEGLAVFVEVISFKSHPARLRRIADRIRAIQFAEQGASFLDIFHIFTTEGRSAEEAYTVTSRVFRGSTPELGPFTKDLSYSKGFILVYNFIRLAVRRGKLERIPLLFCGKLALEDMGTLARLMERGIVIPPKYLPPPLVDLNAITAWMAYSNFLNQIDLGLIETDLMPMLE
ncbi:MAG: flavohemoglobin expression-modulating QEGLA motif protein [Gammaproteobacteria bacterium]|nr:flavohemoglobin expression-modulating QEGLA motif protein [Gammaproteobacteria bacterium]MDH5650568.1 flavohemoglobin expression-modulating QEGLA motif protein [Gammaproteobacteria bacterium]